MIRQHFAMENANGPDFCKSGADLAGRAIHGQQTYVKNTLFSSKGILQLSDKLEFEIPEIIGIRQ